MTSYLYAFGAQMQMTVSFHVVAAGHAIWIPLQLTAEDLQQGENSILHLLCHHRGEPCTLAEVSCQCEAWGQNDKESKKRLDLKQPTTLRSNPPQFQRQTARKVSFTLGLIYTVIQKQRDGKYRCRLKNTHIFKINSKIMCHYNEVAEKSSVHFFGISTPHKRTRGCAKRLVDKMR